ncbi:MAG: adenylate kinase [Promethearchaeota archaeon]
MNIMLFGAPGAGKGTLAGQIKKVFKNIVHISTGDLFRENVRQQTPIGKKAKEYMDAGKLVPDEVVIGMVKERINKEDVKKYGFMLDGFPRTVNQAKELLKLTTIDLILVIEVPREELIKRIVGRISCPKCGKIYNKFNPDLMPKNEGICDVCGVELIHRSDDNEETINKRIDTYESQSLPCIDFFKQKGLKIKIVDGTKTTKMSEQDIKSLLEI